MRDLSPPDLSIIVPAFNESRRIGPTLEAIRAYVAGNNLHCELVVVDDGSRDHTAEVVRAAEVRPLVVNLLSNERNHGKGHAVRKGMLAAQGELLLLCDADMSTPIAEFGKLRPWLDQGCDVVIGSRDLPASRLDPPQPLPRRLAAWTFRALRRRLLLSELQDTQCGFKLFRRAVARRVFAQATIDGWLFDCEILALAANAGYRIKEVGVVWQNHPDTRVRALREVFTALPTLLAIRRRTRIAHG